MRVGIGYDSHRFESGRPLVLGGVFLPDHAGLKGHSDGDAVAHALIDALLGASALGDIGQLFPDTDPRWQGADSMELLAATVRVIEERNYQVVNADVTIVTETPRIGPWVDQMAERIAGAEEEVSQREAGYLVAERLLLGANDIRTRIVGAQLEDPRGEPGRAVEVGGVRVSPGRRGRVPCRFRPCHEEVHFPVDLALVAPCLDRCGELAGVAFDSGRDGDPGAGSYPGEGSGAAGKTQY